MTSAASTPKLSRREEDLIELDGPLNGASSMAEVLNDLWSSYSTPVKRGQNVVLTYSQVHNLTFAIVDLAERLTKILNAFNAAGKSEEGGTNV